MAPSRKSTADSEPRHDVLRAVQAALDEITAGHLPALLLDDCCDASLEPLVAALNRLIGTLGELEAFVLPLARGELSAPMPGPDNVLAAPFRELHASLSELTRQAREIARGDYQQRIDFMGDFSEAFNSMVALLAEREESLKAEIARRRQAEEELQHERDLLVAGPLVTMRWEIDDEGSVLYVSPNIAAFGYSADEFMSGRRRYGSLIHADDYDWVVEDGNTKGQSGLESWTQEYRILDAGGEEHWVRDYTHAVRDDGGAVVCYEGYIIDITPQKIAEAALRHREEQLRMLSLADDLTSLYNRRGLFALGEHLMRSARRRKTSLVVLYLDLDGLKEINDRYGHRQGDRALIDVAALIKATIRESDVVARAGGDEFVVLVEGGLDVAEELRNRLDRRIARLNGDPSRSYRLAVSIGLALWRPDEPSTLQDLIERADREMYRVKQAGHQR